VHEPLVKIVIGLLALIGGGFVLAIILYLVGLAGLVSIASWTDTVIFVLSILLVITVGLYLIGYWIIHP
jgi:hypothetical protein